MPKHKRFQKIVPTPKTKKNIPKKIPKNIPTNVPKNISNNIPTDMQKTYQKTFHKDQTHNKKTYQTNIPKTYFKKTIQKTSINNQQQPTTTTTISKHYVAISRNQGNLL